MLENRLLDLLRENCEHNGISYDQLAETLMLTRSHLMACFAGEASPTDWPEATLRAAATWLDIPLAQVYALVGILAPTDFLYSGHVESRLEALYQRMRFDPQYAGVIPPRETWDKTPLESRLALCLMYEQSAQTRLLDTVPSDLLDHAQT